MGQRQRKRRMGIAVARPVHRRPRPRRAHRPVAGQRLRRDRRERRGLARAEELDAARPADPRVAASGAMAIDVAHESARATSTRWSERLMLATFAGAIFSGAAL